MVTVPDNFITSLSLFVLSTNQKLFKLGLWAILYINNLCSFEHGELEHTVIRLMLPVYEKLFNIILNTGIVPDTWTVGIIHSIYKNKGDSKDPSNYRPISLISCFSKVFTSIINNRLTSYADQVHLISESQSGFRKMHSTTDNIFILHSLVNLYPTKKKRLFCTFVDFSKAFDQVNRSFLWVKMLKSNISGNCFNMIKNM